MKTLLISPPWYCFQDMTFHYLPLGIAYIAGALKKSGYNARILNADYLLSPYTVEKKKQVEAAFFHATDKYVKFHDLSAPVWGIIKDAVQKETPDIVGISIWSGSYLSSINICNIVKELNPDIITVAGGVHATLDPASVIAHPAIDFVVCGEGETAARDLWDVFEAGKDMRERASSISIPGVWYKRSGTVIEGGRTASIEHIDDIPLPDYNVVNGDPAKMILGIITARGCPFNCSFCASSCLWGRNVRFRSIDNCIEELAFYRDAYGLKWLRINDDSFCFKKERVLEFCDKLVGRFGHSWNFAIDANVINLDSEVIEKLEWAGCSSISIGIESVVLRIQKLSNKKIDLQYAKKIISLINKSNMVCGVYFMTGFPEETENELEQNIRFMEDTMPNKSMWSIVTPYPGTALHQYALDKGVLPDVNPIHLMHHSIKTSMADIPEKRYTKILRRILKINRKIQTKYRRRKNWYGLKPCLYFLAKMRNYVFKHISMSEHKNAGA